MDTQRTYNLDLAGNWVSDGAGTPAVSYTHDCGVQDTEDRTTNTWNQVASVSNSGVPVTPIQFDAKGNLTAYGDLSFTFDAFNRMITATGTGPDGQPVSASYGYDALGRRIQKLVNDAETNFVYDGQQVVEERDEANNLLRQYVWGHYVDELVQQREYERPPFGGPYGDLYPLTDLLYRSWALTHDREGLGLLGGAAYGVAESPIRQLIDNPHHKISVSDWGEDIAISAAVGAITEGAGNALRGPLRTLGRRLGRTVTTPRIGSAFESWLSAGPMGGGRRRLLGYMERAETGSLSEEGPVGPLARWHNRMQARYTYGVPPGDTYAEGRANYFRSAWSLVRTPWQLHHWLIPQNQWGRFVPNYIKNLAWNLKPFANREAHAMVDLAIRNNTLVRWGPGFRQWMALPMWAQSSIRIVGPQSAVHQAIEHDG